MSSINRVNRRYRIILEVEYQDIQAQEHLVIADIVGHRELQDTLVFQALVESQDIAV